MSEEQAWGTAKLTTFRFLFVFILFTLFPFPFTQFPFVETLLGFYDQCCQILTRGFAQNLLHINEAFATEATGSGDKLYDYIFLLLTLTLAFCITVAWGIADRKRYNYNTLYKLLHIYVRYFLAVAMVEYGFAKIFQYQFPPLTAAQLQEPLGNSSPMGLLWKFMGYSPGYNIFIGNAEVLAGLLLFFRRTTLLGACICIAIMCNVAAMNFLYDVPVKIFSVLLLLLAVFVIAKDARRLLSFFILNKPVEAAIHEPYLTNSHNRYLYVTKWFFILFVISYNIYDSYAISQQDAEQPLLYGLYETKTFVLNGDTLPALITDTTRWDRLAVKAPGYAEIKVMNGGRNFIEFVPDSSGKIAVTTYGPEQKSEMSYTATDTTLLIKGIYRNDTIAVTLILKNTDKYPLTKQGFKWVNEKPVNY